MSETKDVFLAVHGLVVKKAGTVANVAEVLDLESARVEAALATAVEAGQVLAARDKFMVTPAGRVWLDEQYPVLFAAQRVDEAFTGAYTRFEVVNKILLSLMTRWQTVTVGGASVPNDHADDAYDAGIIDELGAFHDRAVPILKAFTVTVPRLSAYIDRLDAAQSEILAGNSDFVSGARVSSYHTVWFEMHEDLLRILGRVREE